ncbi:MAG: hypothetical protein K2K75_03950, partial [Muribaculaceae bacterium]|nr:hypothetical protein [Muribaculaceae bacterium]
FAGFYRNSAAVAQLNGFLDWLWFHSCLSSFLFFVYFVAFWGRKGIEPHSCPMPFCVQSAKIIYFIGFS